MHATKNCKIVFFIPSEEDSAVISSTRFSRMKASLLCLIMSLDLEEHNVVDLVKAYKKFQKNSSIPHLNLIIRRGMTVVLNRSGVKAVCAYFKNLQNEIQVDPGLLAVCEKALKNAEVTEFVISENNFRERFLGHIKEGFARRQLCAGEGFRTIEYLRYKTYSQLLVQINDCTWPISSRCISIRGSGCPKLSNSDKFLTLLPRFIRFEFGVAVFIRVLFARTAKNFRWRRRHELQLFA